MKEDQIDDYHRADDGAISQAEDVSINDDNSLRIRCLDHLRVVLRYVDDTDVGVSRSCE